MVLWPQVNTRQCSTGRKYQSETIALEHMKYVVIIFLVSLFCFGAKLCYSQDAQRSLLVFLETENGNQMWG